VSRGDFNVGSIISRFIRLRMRPPIALPLTAVDRRSRAGRAAAVRANALATRAPPEYANVAVTLDGSIVVVVPCSENTYRRLATLCRVMVNALPHPAGMNPHAYRTLVSESVLQRKPRRCVVDAVLLCRFLSLDASVQRALARSIGTTTDRVLSDIRSIDHRANFF
jgi:cleavage and polyadenylation specificity factor subunit 1